MKRWTVDAGGDLWWSDGPQDPAGQYLDAFDLRERGFSPERADSGFAALIEAVHDAGRLRSLAATLDNRLNREQKFTGAQVAVMLRAKAIA